MISLYRMCGGVSTQPQPGYGQAPSSPHVRGCFQAEELGAPASLVFPACAGVFLSFTLLTDKKFRLPRMCGGVSNSRQSAIIHNKSSPHNAGVFLS